MKLGVDRGLPRPAVTIVSRGRSHILKTGNDSHRAKASLETAKQKHKKKQKDTRALTTP
jgi:hypothetical protein